MPIYLVHFTTDRPIDPLQAYERHRLQPGLHLIESDASQSRVYHDIKAGLPRDTPLFVARLDHQPKFKGADPGALAWVRPRFDGMTA